jgi:hypothetical protein
VLHLVYESAQSNNGMHPTANSAAFIRETWVLDALCARRVMPGVMLLHDLGINSLMTYSCREQVTAQCNSN